MRFALRLVLLFVFTTGALAQPGLAALCAADELPTAAGSVSVSAPSDEGDADCCSAGLCSTCCLSSATVIASEPVRAISHPPGHLRPVSTPATHGAPSNDLLRPPIAA